MSHFKLDLRLGKLAGSDGFIGHFDISNICDRLGSGGGWEGVTWCAPMPVALLLKMFPTSED